MNNLGGGAAPGHAAGRARREAPCCRSRRERKSRRRPVCPARRWSARPGAERVAPRNTHLASCGFGALGDHDSPAARARRCRAGQACSSAALAGETIRIVLPGTKGAGRGNVVAADAFWRLRVHRAVSHSRLRFADTSPVGQCKIGEYALGRVAWRSGCAARAVLHAPRWPDINATRYRRNWVSFAKWRGAGVDFARA